MTDTLAIQTDGLTKHYGDVRALVDLNLDVRARRGVGFLGPNGAGKTTTIRTLMDEIRPTAGRASILGMHTRERSVQLLDTSATRPTTFRLPEPDRPGHADLLRNG